MSRYEALGEFLRQQSNDRVPMTFDDVERIIGEKLPRSASDHREWWANDSTHVNAQVWLTAGFKSEQVDMSGRKLVFARVKQPASTADEKYHPLFGLLKDVTVVPPGVDLTEPAYPDWGKE